MITIMLSLMFLAQSAGAQPADSNGYADGGIQRQIYGPSDKTSRVISMKLYCDVDADGNVYSKLGIFDVTDPQDSYGQYFSIGEFPYRDGKTFPLDDRTPGHRNYTLSIAPGKGGAIKFGRPGNEDQISTSIDKLLMLRARNAIDKGMKVTLGSRDFLVVQQLGSLAGFVFFKGDLAERLGSSDIDALYGEFFVKTMRKTAEGRWVPERGPLPIGEVDGVLYELALNPQTNQWVIQQGTRR